MCAKQLCVPFSLKHIALSCYINTKDYLTNSENISLHVGKLAFENMKFYRFHVTDFCYHTTLKFLIGLSEFEPLIAGEHYKNLIECYREYEFYPFCVCNLVGEFNKNLNMNGHLMNCKQQK